jgi:cobalt-zinc-cadmium efflux system protein
MAPHGHSRSHGHRHLVHGGEHRTSDQRALTIALFLLTATMAVEVAAAIVAGSLVLLADAGHMLTDVLALGMALVAVTIAARPAGGLWTYGLGRVEVLAAQANGVSLFIVGSWITYSAIRRLIAPPEVRGGIVLTVAFLGIAVNLAASFVLARGSKESLNVRAAFLHVTTDLAGFVGTALAGLLILLTAWSRFDSIASLGVAALCFASAFTLTRDSMRIVLEGAPGDIHPDEVGRMLAADSEVVEVHDLHVWTVTSGFPALSAHILVGPETDCHAARARLDALLRERFGLDHTTLQVEHASSGKQPLELGSVRPNRPPRRR